MTSHTWNVDVYCKKLGRCTLAFTVCSLLSIAHTHLPWVRGASCLCPCGWTQHSRGDGDGEQLLTGHLRTVPIKTRQQEQQWLLQHANAKGGGAGEGAWEWTKEWTPNCTHACTKTQEFVAVFNSFYQWLLVTASPIDLTLPPQNSIHILSAGNKVSWAKITSKHGIYTWHLRALQLDTSSFKPVVYHWNVKNVM